VDFDFTVEQSRYQMITAMKKAMPDFVAGGVLFNQKILTACGKIDTAMSLLSENDKEKFMAENVGFFSGFAWIYYQDWRISRAKSCAHLMDIYKLLNVKFKLGDFVGETFYAGIPTVTADEVNTAVDRYEVSNFSREKIGIDGKLHPCDEYGDFLPF
jgi:hypothetical protein